MERCWPFPDLMNRILEKELLDELPPNDPRALQSRNDLRRINWWMRNPATIAALFKKRFSKTPKKVVDLCAGDGDFSEQLARRLGSSWRNVHLVLVDQKEATCDVRAAFKPYGWDAEFVVADVFRWLENEEQFDCIYANLCLHHFSSPQLEQIFRAISQRTPYFVACEPRRYRFSFIIRFFLWVIGCSKITRDDGVISVRAGFRNAELSQLWPKESGWVLREYRKGLFSHVFEAVKEDRKREP